MFLIFRNKAISTFLLRILSQSLPSFRSFFSLAFHSHFLQASVVGSLDELLDVELDDGVLDVELEDLVGPALS